MVVKYDLSFHRTLRVVANDVDIESSVSFVILKGDIDSYNFNHVGRVKNAPSYLEVNVEEIELLCKCIVQYKRVEKILINASWFVFMCKNQIISLKEGFNDHKNVNFRFSQDFSYLDWNFKIFIFQVF